MGDILGIGVTHYPGLIQSDQQMAGLLQRTLNSEQVPDAFKPDFVLIWGDDQYENFREDGVPSFCVFAVDSIESRPFARYAAGNTNVWGEGKDTVIHTKGHYAAASTLAAGLIKEDYDVSYAYRMRYENGLPHAFINTILYLDYDRKGFPYPLVPFHVNCYGSSVIAKRGSTAHLTGHAESNPIEANV